MVFSLKYFQNNKIFSYWEKEKIPNKHNLKINIYAEKSLLKNLKVKCDTPWETRPTSVKHKLEKMVKVG